MAVETIAAANGIAGGNSFGAVASTIYLSNTCAFEGFGRAGPLDYSRTANPTRAMLADSRAKLEDGAGGRGGSGAREALRFSPSPNHSAEWRPYRPSSDNDPCYTRPRHSAPGAHNG
jgi:hypothetical protein